MGARASSFDLLGPPVVRRLPAEQALSGCGVDERGERLGGVQLRVADGNVRCEPARQRHAVVVSAADVWGANEQAVVSGQVSGDGAVHRISQVSYVDEGAVLQKGDHSKSGFEDLESVMYAYVD